MEILNILVTGSGAPGAAGTLYSLRNNFDGRKVRIVGTDISPDAAGRFLCDGFHLISRPDREEYVADMEEVCRKESIEVVIPQNTAELLVLSKNKKHFAGNGVKIAVSSEKAVSKSNDKQALLEMARQVGVPTPWSRAVKDMESLEKAAAELGWPEEKVVVKPPNSSGMRGFRVIDEHADLKSMFYGEKPSSVVTTMKQLRSVLGEKFPELMVTEFLPGTEYSVDVLSANHMTVIPRRRDSIRSGITFQGSLDKREDIISYSERLSKSAGLEYAFGFQFKLDKEGVPKLLECNPRVQGSMVISTLAGANIIYGAVKLAMGEQVPEFSIDWSAKLIRYWGAVGVSGDRIIGVI